MVANLRTTDERHIQGPGRDCRSGRAGTERDPGRPPIGSNKAAPSTASSSFRSLSPSRTKNEEPNKPQKSVSDQQREEQELVRRNKAIVDTEKIIDGHHGKTHARTNAERDQLRRDRDRLIAAQVDDISNLTTDQAESITKAIEKMVREMKPSALGS